MDIDDHDHISLIDLSKQFPFDIDNELKKELCFSETLVVSCGHFKGVIGEELSNSNWSCSETTESEKSVEVNDVAPFEVQDKKEHEPDIKHEDEDEDNFCFYFFPDCNKPINVSKDSEASLVIVDGVPKLNSAKKSRLICKCVCDKTGKCTCFTKLPCECNAKTFNECICATKESICICHNGNPQPECECKPSDICICLSDGRICPECKCTDIHKPCICDNTKYPNPICNCIHKPNMNVTHTMITEDVSTEGEGDVEELVEIESESIDRQCECQKPELESNCQCLRNEECICRKNACICEVRKECICEHTEIKEAVCKGDESKSICVCPIYLECTYDAEKSDDCKCFPTPTCTCSDPENCKCRCICNCTFPCICGTTKEDECTCFTKETVKSDCECLLKIDDVNKLKRVKAGKQGYRWCHDVDPRHTYFGYGYNRYDKICYKEENREKLKILGLYEEKHKEVVSAVHGIKAPPYERKVVQPSIDCCSAVGGLSICVETLGEDKDKFLVQMVSHSSKEGAKSGSKLVSIMDCNLHTMEENRTEYISKKDMAKERRSYMAICDSGYYNKITRICGDRHVVKRNYYSFEQVKNLLLEGANIVLMRYLGLRRYRGNIKTETVMMNGAFCESIYVSLGVSQAIVNGKPLFVVKVERHIIEPNGYVHQMLTVLTLRGYIVSHEWANNTYILHLNPLLRVYPEKDEIEPHAPLREKWREDLQLMSDYLDFKSSRSSEGARYVSENGALTATVRDYLQALLLLKPQDALHFTRHYFGAALSALDLPHNEYFDPSTRHVRYYFFEE